MGILTPFVGASNSPRQFVVNNLSSSIDVAGDSLSAQNNDAASDRSYNEAAGSVTWANVLSGQRLDLDVPGFGDTGNNFAVGGDTTVDMIALLPLMKSSSSKWIFFTIGTNDTNNLGYTYSEIAANLTTIFDTLLSVGKLPVVTVILPRVWDDPIKRQKAQRLCHFVRNWNKNNPTKRGIVVIDPTRYMADAANANGEPLSGITGDGVHSTPAGAYLHGKAIYEAMRDFLPPREEIVCLSNADVYDATNNPNGNLLTNGMMASTGGTAGTGVSGDISTDWTMDRGSGTGITAVGAKSGYKLDGTAGSAQEFLLSTASAGAATDLMYFRQHLASNYAEGDIVRAAIEVTCYDVIGSNFYGLSLTLRSEGGTTKTVRDLDRYDATRLMPSEAWTGVLLTPKLVVPAGSTSLRFRVEFGLDGTKTGSMRARLDRAKLWKV